MRVAIVHYWLVGMRGGEKVVEELCDIFPQADVFTHVYKPSAISKRITSHEIKTTFINQLPFAQSQYQYYLPLMPLALEQINLDDYDLVISSESGPAKGVITRPDALHICYCHSPMRYVWSAYHEYRGRTDGVTRLLMPHIMHRMRMWDHAAADRVDHFIANSHNVAERIWKYYRRQSTVIYPPVSFDAAVPSPSREDFYLFVSQLVPYKNADVAVEAFNRMGKRLLVIGQGEEYARLKRCAGPTVELLGHQSDEMLKSYYARCRALVFVANEDFGMVPVEAMKAGTPVLAYRGGGALETVVDGETGLFMNDQTPDSLIDAVERFEAAEHRFDSARIIRWAQQFSANAFKQRMTDVTNSWLDDRLRRRAAPQRQVA